MTSPSPSYMTPPQVARMLGVKPSKVGKWIADASLKAVDLSEGRRRRPRWKISQQSLEEFLAARANRKPVKSGARRRRASLVPTEYFK